MRRLLLTAFCSLVALSPTLRAQTPGEVGSLAILLGNEKVREALEITTSQASELDAIRSNYRSAARKIADGELPNAKSRDNAQAALDRLTLSSNKRVLGVLNSSQSGKLVKIENKFLGATHLYSASVQKHLGLSATQSQQIAEIRSESEQTVAATNRLFEEGKISFHERLRTLREDRLSQGKELLSLLTPAQRDSFAAITR